VPNATNVQYSAWRRDGRRAIVRDSSGLAQVVVSDEGGRSQLDDLNEETVVSVDGTSPATPKRPVVSS
jgi:aspartyl-tRNA synthetase